MRRKLGLGMVFTVALGIPVAQPVRADEAASRGPAPGEARPDAAASDGAITAHIKSGLAASTDLRNAGISVSTNNGVVTLNGTVPSREVRETAIDLARGTGGVIRVDDNLRLIGSTPADPEVPMR